MQPHRRNTLAYGLLLVVWVVVVGWQVKEHYRAQAAAKSDLRDGSREVANTLSALMRTLRFRGGILQERLEPALNELVNGRTNQLVESSKLVSVVLLNTASEPLLSVGAPIDFSNTEILQEGEQWAANTATFVIPVSGENVSPEGATNTAPTATVVISRRDFTNGPPGTAPNFPRRDRPDDLHPLPPPDGPPILDDGGHGTNLIAQGGGGHAAAAAD